MPKVALKPAPHDPRPFPKQEGLRKALIVYQADRLIAEIRPFSPKKLQLRPFGLCAGEFSVPEDFDAPLPEDILSTV